MPKFRSITLSIVSGWEHRLHPEFPHPMSQKFRLSNSQNLGVEARAVPRYDEDEEEIQEYSYLPERRGTPQVSVYIPSCPGTRFWVRYTIGPDHPPCKFFYFKLYMNGRHITSWGINPKERPAGQIMRGLFNPSLENNMEDAPPGIQSRHFYFSPEPESESEAALDGGLIEVRCFRAAGKKKRAARPEEFRDGQKRYGLELPTCGLLNAPEEARFYDWILLDPKDEPYASFRFHYRTWENLEALSLIPSQNIRILVSRSVSLQSLRGRSVASDEIDSNHKDVNREVKRQEDHKDSKSDNELTLQPDMIVKHNVVQGFDENATNGSSLNLEDKSIQRRSLPVPGAKSSQSTEHLEDITTNDSSPMVAENVIRRPLPVPGAQSTMKHNTLDDVATISLKIPEKSVHRRPLPLPTKAMVEKDLKNRQAAESFTYTNRIEPQSNHVVQAGESIELPILDDIFPHVRGLNIVKKPRPLPTPQPSLPVKPDLSDRPPTPFAAFLSESIDGQVPRLLPLPPKRSQAELRRTPSEISTAQSITPSLYSYVNRETSSESPEPIIGVAAVVPMISSCIYADDSINDEGLSLFSVDSPQRNVPEEPRSYGITRPPEAMFSPAGLAAIRQSKDSADYVPYVPPTKLPMATFYDDRSFRQRMKSARASVEAVEKNTDQRDESTDGLGEDDWVLRTPSPVRRKYEGTSKVRGRWSINASEDSSMYASEHREVAVLGRSRVRASLPPTMERLRGGSMQRDEGWGGDIDGKQ